ncbi:MAG: outer membrane beta-barrel protein [Gammaproteobacteria bacterium]|nr:outer membrane beta-barrel protein [Gammaproteobacteria bacterium]
MICKLKQIALFSASIILCSATYALTDVYSTEHITAPPAEFEGQYVSVNAGATYANVIHQYPVTESGFLGAGGSIFLGDKINPYFGPEIGVGYYSFGSWGGATIVSLNAKFTIPMSDFSLFAKVGAAFGELTTRFKPSANTIPIQSDEFLPSLGAGLGYNFMSRWTGSVECNGAYFPGSKNGNGFIGGLTAGITHYFTL